MPSRPYDPFADEPIALTREYVERKRAADVACEREEAIQGLLPPEHAEGFVLHVLASGSKGNAAVLRWGESAVLIDCGITKKAFFERCAEARFDPRQIKAVAITHEHTDHTNGLGVVMRGLAKEGVRPKLFTTTAIHRASAKIREVDNLVEVSHVNAQDDFDMAGIRTFTFPTHHDSVESMGFRFEAGNEGDRDVVGYVTDTGIVDDTIRAFLENARILALESNHDPRMLENGPYPPSLKRRVGGVQGHLSNLQSAEFVEELLSDRLECILGMHLSEHNNTPAMAQAAIEGVLARNGHSAKFWTASQHRAITVY